MLVGFFRRRFVARPGWQWWSLVEALRIGGGRPRVIAGKISPILATLPRRFGQRGRCAPLPWWLLPICVEVVGFVCCRCVFVLGRRW